MTGKLPSRFHRVGMDSKQSIYHGDGCESESYIQIATLQKHRCLIPLHSQVLLYVARHAAPFIVRTRRANLPASVFRDKMTTWPGTAFSGNHFDRSLVPTELWTTCAMHEKLFPHLPGRVPPGGRLL